MGGKTIGFVNITPNYASTAAETAFKAAAADLGWKVVDGSTAQDVGTAQQSVQTLLNRHVNAIVMQSVDPGELGQQLAEAHKMGIPVISQENGSGYQYLYNGSILAAPDWDFSAQGSLIGTFFIRKVLEASGGKPAQVILFTGLPTLPSQQLWVGAVKAELAQNPEIKVVGEHSVDYSKPGADISSYLGQMLTAHPDVKGIFTAANLEAPATAAAVQAAGKTGKIVVTTFFDDPDILSLIRSGGISGTVTVPVDQGSWQSADALVQYFSGKPVDKNASLTDPLVPEVIDKSNVPAAGKTVPEAPFKQTFLNKWCKTDGVQSACKASS